MLHPVCSTIINQLIWDVGWTELLTASAAMCDNDDQYCNDGTTYNAWRNVKKKSTNIQFQFQCNSFILIKVNKI